MSKLQVKFWGASGSLPSPHSYTTIQEKLLFALTHVKQNDLVSKDSIESYIQSLPFHIKGTYGGNTSCVELIGGEQVIILDAGTGIRNYCQENAIPATKEFHLFLSHLHWDHIQGFPFFRPAYVPGNTIHIYGFHKDIVGALKNQQQFTHFPAEFKDLQADIIFHELELGRQYNILGFTVEGLLQNHPNLSYGYSFVKEGKKFVYSTDSEHYLDKEDDINRYINFIQDADVLIFDAQYIFRDAVVEKMNWGHSSNIIGVELALKANVKHLCLFHHEHTSSDTELYEYFESTRKYLKMLSPESDMIISGAYEGMLLDI